MGLSSKVDAGGVCVCVFMGDPLLWPDFHSADPSALGTIGEGGDIAREPLDSDKVWECRIDGKWREGEGRVEVGGESVMSLLHCHSYWRKRNQPQLHPPLCTCGAPSSPLTSTRASLMSPHLR